MIAIVCALLILMIIVWYYYTFSGFETVYLKSNLDGNAYEVLKHYHDPKYGGSDAQGAADMMAKIHYFIMGLVKYMEKEFITEKYASSREYTIAKRLSDRYRGSELIKENWPTDPAFTSFTLNKSTMAFCLRDEKTKVLHDLEIILFVVMHELSHMATEEYQHGEQFWTDFKFLLKVASDAGLYTPVDFSKDERYYCGLHVKYNPYFDEKINLAEDYILF